MKFGLDCWRMRKLIFSAFVFLLPFAAHADQLSPYSFVSPVTQQDGDTVSTSQVSVGVCPGSSCPTLVSAAITNKTSRRRIVLNTGSYKVYIGSNTTTLTTTGFQLGESTGTLPSFTTYNTAAIYATAVSTETIDVIQESNSNP